MSNRRAILSGLILLVTDARAGITPLDEELAELARSIHKPVFVAANKVDSARLEADAMEFERWGFGAVAIPAMLPPPFPIVPALLAAGAMQYPRKKFLAALAVGRGIRFTIVAFLGAHYGRHIVAFFSRYYKPALLTLIALAVIGGIVALVQYLQFRKKNATQPKKRSKPVSRRKVA